MPDQLSASSFPPPADHEVALDAIRRLRVETQKVIIGQESVIDEILLALLCQGHVLLIGVPGLAKTMLVSALARAMRLTFRRIQFTPDLMPSDVTGAEMIQEDRTTGERSMRFARGPLFANIILADEINRTPPKTQAALLEAMQERQITVGGEQYALPEPFFVLATQNPIEHEGTYPLPEAQLDRFMLCVQMTYPSAADELRIIQWDGKAASASVAPVVTADDLMAARRCALAVPAAEHVVRYALAAIRSTRPDERAVSTGPARHLRWGAGPRAGQYLLAAARAKAFLAGDPHVTVAHIQAVAQPVLRHRLILNFQAEADGITIQQVVADVLALASKQANAAGELDAVLK
jgi:MoxR-like ATPase